MLKTNWPIGTVMVLLYAGALAALFMFNWQAFAASLFTYWLTIGVGISMGYQRLHTHRSYKVPLGIEYLFAVFGALTLQGGPISWVATHRINHQKSDQSGDPNSPRDGRWWAHVGRVVFGPSNHNDTRKMSKYAPDLSKHRFYVWLNNYHWVPSIVLAVLLVVGLHATWLVNFATHMWGGRRFATPDGSRTNWWVALVTFGEGWHNNHHAYPTSARHGLAWYEFDLSWIQIRMLKFAGIAKSIQVAKWRSARARVAAPSALD